MSFTHSIWEPSHIWPHIADGSVNPFHEGIFLIRWTLHESPSILQLLSQPEVSGYSGYRCQSFYSVSNTYDTVYSCVPKSQKPCCQRLPMRLPKLFTQVNQLHLSMWSICHELSHIGGPLRMLPPQAIVCSCFTSAVQWASLTSGNPQSHSIHHHPHLPSHCQRCWILQGHGALALMPIYVALVLPRISAHCNWHGITESTIHIHL